MTSALADEEDSAIIGLKWDQVGADIDGEAGGDLSGDSISLSADGSRVAIGAEGNDGNGENSGQVRVFDWSPTGWVQLGADIDGQLDDDQAGRSVSLSADGSRLAIGARPSAADGFALGQVRVFEFDEDGWVQLGGDIAREPEGHTAAAMPRHFWVGSVSLSADGSRVAVGDSLVGGNGWLAGQVRVFDWSGSAWVQVGDDLNGEAEDQFGWSVSLAADGSRLAVGAPNNGDLAGQVRVFDWLGSEWVQVGGKIRGESEADHLGFSVSLSDTGSRLAVGAPRNDGNGMWSGHVRVFDWSPTRWVQLGTDIDGEAVGDFSGSSVSLSGDGSRLVVGAPLNSGDGLHSSGHVRVFEWSGSGWAQVGNDLGGEGHGDESGSSVSSSADGNLIAIGARLNRGTDQTSGSVRIFGFVDEVDG